MFVFEDGGDQIFVDVDFWMHIGNLKCFVRFGVQRCNRSYTVYANVKFFMHKLKPKCLVFVGFGFL